MKRVLLCFIGLLLMSLMIGCNKSQVENNMEYESVNMGMDAMPISMRLDYMRMDEIPISMRLDDMTTEQREFVLGQTVSPKDMDNIVIMENINEFSHKFYDNVYKKDNFVISPISIYVLLCLLAEGADGKTQKEIADVLKIDMNDIDFTNNYVKKLFENRDFEMSNCIYINKKEQFEKSFLDLAKNIYFCEVKGYSDNPVKDINDWVNQKTHGNIPTLTDKIDPNTIMTLLNSAYYKGIWQKEFKKLTTGKFNFQDGKTKKVKFMVSDEEQNVVYVQGGYLYKLKTQTDTTVFFILPPENVDLKDYLSSFDLGVLLRMRNFTGENWVVMLPKFEIESGVELNDVLKNMGIKDAFYENNADFSKIRKVKDIWISDANQKAKIKVDEKGVEAVVSTKFDLSVKSAPMPKKTLIFDRPFGVVIANKDGIPLFMGAIYDPTKEN